MYLTLVYCITVAVKPFCNLSLPLSVQPHLGVLCDWWNTHNGVNSIMASIILLFFVLCF